MKIFTLFFLLTSFVFCKSQIVTLTLTASEDAAIGFHDGASTANNNYGNAIQNAAFCIQASASYTGVNVNRALIRFNLSSLPAGANIISAQLDLFALGPYGSLGGHSGNANSFVLERVTQNWNESTVTWNNQPPSTNTNCVTLTNSNSFNQDYLNIPVTNMVVDMLNSNANFGFKLRLINENKTNSILFCSKDYSNTAKHPRLIIQYNTCSQIQINQSKTKICEGDSVLLAVNILSNFQWSTGQTNTTITVKPTITTTYSVARIGSECNSPSTATVQVVPKPVVIINNLNASICQGQTAVLIASGAQNYLWNTGATNNPLTINPNITSIYTVTGTSNGCSNSFTTKVQVIPPPILAISGSTNICSGITTSLTAQGADNYFWNGQLGSSQYSFTPFSSTTLTITGTNSLGCTSTQTLFINVSRCTSLNEIDSKENNWSPIPTNQFIEKELQSGTTIYIIGLDGKVLFKRFILEQQVVEIDLRSLNFTDGIYHLITERNGVSENQRIVLTH